MDRNNTNFCGTKACGMLGVSAEDVEPTKKIVELGADSLMSIEVKV
jgi:acyl carrier protein